MSRTKLPSKTSQASISNVRKGKSVIPTAAATPPLAGIRILHQGTSKKLTNRGRGDLSYELGIDESTGESHIRISANASSGVFSREWLAFSSIRALLARRTEPHKPFSAITLESLFTRRSANNHGYLAAVLITEAVLVALPGKPVMLNQGSWELVEKKISTLKDQGVGLTDHIAIATQKKAEQKAQQMETLQKAKLNQSTEPEAKIKELEIQAEPIEPPQAISEGE